MSKAIRYSVVALALAAGACDDEGDQASTVTLTSGCKWGAFEASVREGPNAPMTLSGVLTVAGIDDAGSELGGMLVTADLIVPVSGRLGGGEIEIELLLDEGTVVGKGPLGVDGDPCEEGLEGDLVGPSPGDTGDWLGVGLIDYDDPNSTYELSPDGGVGSEGGDFTFDSVTEQVSGSCTKTTEDPTRPENFNITCVNGGNTCKFIYVAGQLAVARCRDKDGKPLPTAGNEN